MALLTLRSKVLTCGYSRALEGTRTPAFRSVDCVTPVRYLPIPALTRRDQLPLPCQFRVAVAAVISR